MPRVREVRFERRNRLHAQGISAIQPPSVTIVDGVSSAIAKPVQAVTGGQGGTVLLIVAIMLFAYLFVTRRLAAVIAAIAAPAPPAFGGAPSVMSGPSSRPTARRRGGGTGDGGSTGGGLEERIREAAEARGEPDTYRNREVRPQWEYPDGRPAPPPRRLRGGFYVR